MLQYLMKVAISSILIVLVSETSKRSSWLGGLLASLPLVTGALDHVPEVRNHTGFNNDLTVGVKVDAPGIAGAFGEDLEFMFDGVIPPDGGIDTLPLAGGGAGFAHV